MSDFWKKIKSLFSASEQSSPSQPAIREMIVRSEEELADYQQWKKTLSARRMLDWIKDQYIQYKINPDNVDETVYFLNTPSSKGFVVHFYQTRYNKREVTHLFDWFKEKVLTLKYRSYLSDLRTYNRTNWVETVQRHYLKPPINLRLQKTDQFDQKFGNITIELLFRNEQLHQLKFRATAYTDRKFKTADQFEDLILELTG